MSPVPAWLRAMRPKQWVKNILVFAAPVAAGALFDPRVLVNTLWAFLAFSLISASIYLINDVRDVEADRLHPKKRFRPIAAGELGSTPAIVLVPCRSSSLTIRSAPVICIIEVLLGAWEPYCSPGRGRNKMTKPPPVARRRGSEISDLLPATLTTREHLRLLRVLRLRTRGRRTRNGT